MQADLSLGARLCPPPPFAIAGKGKPTAAQRAGLRYEEKALTHCEGWARAAGYSPLSKQWIEYRDLSGLRWAEIDFFALSDFDDNLVVVEIKIRHTRDAFRQLARYAGLLQTLYPDRVVSPIELCQYYDCDEAQAVVLDNLRPHNLPRAAVIWEPSPLRYYNG